jgi:chemotaxis protein methyltransferase CheR
LALRQKYFTQLDKENFQISADLREVIKFSHVNIVDALQMTDYHDFDVIFCRNLLIYFDDQSRVNAAEHIYDALKPGGYICLGHSESMSRISSLFTIKKFPETTVYQKPL